MKRGMFEKIYGNSKIKQHADLKFLVYESSKKFQKGIAYRYRTKWVPEIRFGFSRNLKKNYRIVFEEHLRIAVSIILHENESHKQIHHFSINLQI